MAAFSRPGLTVSLRIEPSILQSMSSPLFDRSDREFISQLADSGQRQIEIARLIRIRRHFFLNCALLFVLGVASRVFAQGTDMNFIWILCLGMALGYLDAQNRLRVLQLADHLHSMGEVPSVIRS